MLNINKAIIGVIFFRSQIGIGSFTHCLFGSQDLKEIFIKIIYSFYLLEFKICTINIFLFKSYLKNPKCGFSTLINQSKCMQINFLKYSDLGSEIDIFFSNNKKK